MTPSCHAVVLLSWLLCLTVPAALAGDMYGYDYEFGSEHGFGQGASFAGVSPPVVTLGMAENLKEEADSGSKDSQYFYGLLRYYGEAVDTDRSVAAKYFRKAANQGHLEAMTNLALMSYSGEGSAQDDRAALAWFHRAAEAGHAEAQWMLGRMYYDGRGPEGRNMVKALQWFQKSAEQLNPRGCFYMGLMCEYGLATERDFYIAREYYKLGAEKEDVRSMYHLGLMYLDGRGGDVDYARASLWFDAAAKHQYGPACYFLGLMHLEGQGFMVDYDVALTWFTLARDSGDMLVADQAAEAVDQLSRLLEEARVKNQEIRNKYDAHHPDFDPDFEKGRPYPLKPPSIVQQDPTAEYDVNRNMPKPRQAAQAAGNARRVATARRKAAAARSAHDGAEREEVEQVLELTSTGEATMMDQEGASQAQLGRSPATSSKEKQARQKKWQRRGKRQSSSGDSGGE